MRTGHPPWPGPTSGKVATGKAEPDAAVFRRAADSWESGQDRIRALLRAVRLLPLAEHGELVAAAVALMAETGDPFGPANAALLRESHSPQALRLLREHGAAAVAAPILDALWEIESVSKGTATEPAGTQDDLDQGPIEELLPARAVGDDDVIAVASVAATTNPGSSPRR